MSLKVAPFDRHRLDVLSVSNSVNTDNLPIKSNSSFALDALFTLSNEIIVSFSFCLCACYVCQQFHCKSNHPIHLNSLSRLGPYQWEESVQFDGDPVPDTDHFSVSFTTIE